MRRTRAAARLAAVALMFTVAGALATGCSNDDGGVDSGNPAGGADPASDTALAEALNLHLDQDVPSGYQVDESSDSLLVDSIATCLGLDPAATGRTEARSPRFDSAAVESARSIVSVSPTVEDATAMFAAFDGVPFGDCYARTIASGMTPAAAPLGEVEPDVTFGEPLDAVMPVTAEGDDAVARRITIPVSGAATDLDLFVDVLSVRVGRITITTIFTSTVMNFDTALGIEITQSAVDRAS